MVEINGVFDGRTREALRVWTTLRGAPATEIDGQVVGSLEQAAAKMEGADGYKDIEVKIINNTSYHIASFAIKDNATSQKTYLYSDNLPFLYFDWKSRTQRGTISAKVPQQECTFQISFEYATGVTKKFVSKREFVQDLCDSEQIVLF